jgi:flagellar hook-associated protein 1 FlgK|tara:strand:- start:9433 stop:10887 length:1455 start_codon:yes stop_codon:yes gene_type:complete
MTISSALNNAMTGLRAAGRATQVVSSNLSNALTEGYGARSLELSSQSMGGLGGVRVDGITRNVDPVLVSDRQMASAAYANKQTTLGFMTELDRLIGTPDQVGALTQQISAFESSLITAASRPDAPDRLAAAVNSARDLATTIKRASSGIQDQRTRADQTIGDQVTRLNAALSELQTLNGQITKAQVRGANDVSFLDYRQKLVDEISAIVPVKTVARANGAIALFTTGGSVLIDGKAAEVGFDPVNLVGAGMSLDAGSLSGLTVNGVDVRTGPDNGALRGGGLSAQFEIRDQMAPHAQEQLDAVARDLIERFEALAPLSLTGDPLPGLFTDNGSRFDDLDETGLAGRLTVNQLVDPTQGGDTWKLRDGLGATTTGDVGNSTHLQSLGDVLSSTRQPASGDFGTGSLSAVNLSSTMISMFANDRTNNEQHLSFASVQLDELIQQELANGVDSDAELQRLILIEQAYAANARMIQTVDEMMQTLLRI